MARKKKEEPFYQLHITKVWQARKKERKKKFGM
jgi:hypothetical protein